MPKFKIGREYCDVAGHTVEEVVECDSQEEADEIAREQALENVSYWARQIED